MTLVLILAALALVLVVGLVATGALDRHRVVRRRAEPLVRERVVERPVERVVERTVERDV